MEIGYKIWLTEKDNKIFGRGPKELLIRTEQMGSLRRAASSMNMSYSKAWSLVSNLEKSLNIQILDKKVGGANGGSSTLTDEGRALVEKYDRLEKEIDEAIIRIYNGIF